MHDKFFGGGRAFSDLFGKSFGTDEIGKKLCDFGKKTNLVPMKLGKNCVILGEKNMTILEKNSAIFNKIGKVYLLNSDFSANWECSRSIGNFFTQLVKNLVPKTGPSFV